MPSRAAARSGQNLNVCPKTRPPPVPGLLIREDHFELTPEDAQEAGLDTVGLVGYSILISLR